jgi:N-methyl-L-tryptophan oxidase
MLQNHYDVIVLGAGSMGMSAGYYLTKLGIRPLLIDALDPPHTWGSHHGSTRNIRHAYTDAAYVPLLLRAQKLWRDLEEEAELNLFYQTGLLGLSHRDDPFIQETKMSAAGHNLPLEVLPADEIQKRWPGWKVPDDVTGCFEPQGGILFSEQCIRAYRRLASTQKATLLTNCPVDDLHLHAHGVTVDTRQGSYHADKLIVSAGAWTTKLLHRLQLPLQPVRKVFAWFEVPERLYGYQHWPAFFVKNDTRIYYGSPSVHEHGLKVGRHDGGLPVDPDKADRTVGPNEREIGDIENFLQHWLPGAGQKKTAKACLYTLTPDEHFIIDVHPDHSHVFLAAGFSGHGFKFSSVVGEILSELVTQDRTELDISLFSLQRFLP